jgi:hypothetical protein
MTIVVKTMVTLKRDLVSLQSARQYVETIRSGKGKYKKAKLEIHYNPRKRLGKWSVVAHNPILPPGGATCGACGVTHFQEDDYLCPDCRKAA